MSRTRHNWIWGVALVLATLAAFAIGLSMRGPAGEMDGGESAAATVWTCSMHPQIQLPQPGACPICGMDLIPLAAGGGDEGPRSLSLSPSALKLAEIRTAPVERKPVQATVRMVGKLEVDETRMREISAWVSGRIERLHVDTTGVRVRRGQELFELYSPELYSAQEELLQAIAAADQLGRSGLESTRRSAARTVEAARERLRLWGLTSEQITEVETRGTPSNQVPIVAPISGVVMHKAAVEGTYVETGTHVYSIADLSVLWLKLDVYESDLAWVELGQTVEFATEVFPGEVFSGDISFIDPMLDERSRSVKVRVEVANSDGRLRPGMFARAVLRVDIRTPDGRDPLVVPASAPLVTGTRAVVYVADPEEAGRFHGREIALGPRAQEHYVVREGLQEGERVVFHGSFKIDSALQILAKPSMMNPQGGGTGPGHQHGPAPVSTGAPSAAPIAGVSDAFRRQFDRVLEHTFAVSTALSQDDLPGARRAATSLGAELERVDHPELPPDGHRPWTQAQQAAGRAATAVAAATGLDQARGAFHDLSQAMIRAVRRFGASGAVPVLLYHCPMARDGAGAEWLQLRTGTENPYYGSAMYRCGSETETLVAGPSADHAGH